MKIHKSDKVQIITGKDKGKQGEVTKVFTKKGAVVVSGLNIVKRHQKSRGGAKGGIISIEKPISVSKLLLVCPRCSKPSKVGYKGAGENKSRYCRKCKSDLG